MGMNFEIASYFFAIFGNAFLIVFAVYHVIAFDELRSDYKNPIELCEYLNPLVLPECAIHVVICLVFLLCGEWLTFFINAPLIISNAWRYKNRPVMTGPGLYDPTTILRADEMLKNIRYSYLRMSFYMALLLYYIYGFARSFTNT